MKEHPLIDGFLLEMERTALLPARTSLVAGVSGGGDSMALLVLLAAGRRRFGWDVTAVHVNHGLRPEAKDDEAFVREWSARFAVPCVAVAVTVMPGHGRSLEMAAREARHGALDAEAKERKALVVLAHQADDQAETVLLRILRGTGVSGLAAMRPRAGRIVRPLLPLRGEALRAMLRDLDIPWREDVTNQDPDMLRNRIRHELLPLMRSSYNPRVTEALLRLSHSAAVLDDWAQTGAAEWFSAHAESEPGGGALRLRHFAELPVGLRRQVLRLAADHFQIHITEEQNERAEGGPTAWPGHHAVTHQGSDLVVRPPTGAPPRWPEAPLEPSWPGRLELPLGFLVVERSGCGKPVTTMAGQVEELRVRGWRAGDRIRLRTGHKKLQDLFVDKRVPRSLRRAWPLLVDGEDRVVGVPGLAVDPAWTSGSGWGIRWDRDS